MDETQAICRIEGRAGTIVLNRPKALNALTLDMVRLLAGALDTWEHDPAVERIVVTGAGEKAFCAGGDIRLLWEQGKAGAFADQLAFWREEYVLNVRIARYAKPYVALIDGIVMGGGAGVSIHGSHRIAGDRYLFAMPEVGIGFFPDIGATAFLPDLPDHAGAYLALTGARVKAGDAVALGLADAYVPSARMGELSAALRGAGDTDAIVAQFAAPPPPSALSEHRDLIARVFSAEDVMEIVARLEREAKAGSAFAAETLATLRTKSPSSVRIALAQMQAGQGISIEEAMRIENRIVTRLARGHDFYEGVRAVIVDRDNAPQWQPATLEAVEDRDIEAHFAHLPPDEELVFPGSPGA